MSCQTRGRERLQRTRARALVSGLIDKCHRRPKGGNRRAPQYIVSDTVDDRVDGRVPGVAIIRETDDRAHGWCGDMHTFWWHLQQLVVVPFIITNGELHAISMYDCYLQLDKYIVLFINGDYNSLSIAIESL